MSEGYIGEIRMFAGTFAPLGWMFCEGQALPISENDALFNLIGTTYGGDGQNVFNLPDLRGRLPVHQGSLQGVAFQPGQSAGSESVALTAAQLPAHSHPCQASSSPADSPNPGAHVLAETSTSTPYFQGPPQLNLASGSVTPAGGNLAHSNMQPFLCVHFIIAIQGIFPPRG